MLTVSNNNKKYKQCLLPHDFSLDHSTNQSNICSRKEHNHLDLAHNICK